MLSRYLEFVRSTPSAVAARYEASQWTYAELDAQANRIANALVARGVKSGGLVAIALPRGLQMAAAVLGVLKTGAGYLPIDPAYPAERITFMLTDAKVQQLVTLKTVTLSDLPGSVSRLELDDPRALDGVASTDPGLPDSPDDLCYVIYTSGSTGQPKGVAMHRSPLNKLIDWQLKDSKADASWRTLQFAPLSFDVHFQEMFATWSSGGTLVFIAEELRLEAVKLLNLLSAERVNRVFVPFVALQTFADIAVAQNLIPQSLREVVTAGEALRITPQIRKFFEALPQATLHNHYGPSETHVITAYTLTGAPSSWPELPSIGAAIDGSFVRVVDEKLNEVKDGESGELLLGGESVARGYLYRDQLTKERFLTDAKGLRLYRSGDLGRKKPDGTIEYIGRADGQVKIRGYRVEPGEIEAALSAHPALKQTAIVAREDTPGVKRLVAYLVGAQTPAHELVTFLKQRGLPDYMMPSAYVWLGELPRTPSGKIDRRALPAPGKTRPELQTEFVAPSRPLEKKLAELWCELLGLDRVGVNDRFFDLGGNSLIALQSVARLRAESGIDLPVVKLFETPTIAGLAAFLEGGGKQVNLADEARERMKRRDGKRSAIAIVGVAGRFPGARDAEAFWKNLADGVESVSFFKKEELDASIPAQVRNDSRYVPARGVLEDVELFDSSFFGVPPREADVMDPQQRLFLEVSHDALENAGYAPGSLGSVGVFGGTHNNSYAPNNVLTRPDVVGTVGDFQVMVSNEKDYVATRIAHKLGLTGPALSIHTACSTSLVAVITAMRSLQSYECDLALAGGAAVSVPRASGHLYLEGGMLSKDGHCRPFDEKASGTLFSDGVGAVVLKRLDDAQADGDRIWAVLRGGAINNDGAEKASFSAPSVQGQAEVIARAHADAGIEPRSLSYVEAHGTATPLGDPVEVEALTRAFRATTDDVGFCGLGSVKSNFGHLTAAAGVAGLLKTTFALVNETLPRTLHFETPNPRIPFATSPFSVVAKNTPWPKGQAPRRAAVSSFGVGGTNAHVVVEEAPAQPPSGPSTPKQLLVLSARSDAALEAMSERLATWLEKNDTVPLADVAWTLQTGRRAFAHRRTVVAGSSAQAAAALRSKDARSVQTKKSDGSRPQVSFLFPGQGSQYVGMGKNLAAVDPTFRAMVDRCADIVSPLLGRDLREVMWATQGADADKALRQTAFTQSALFTLEYSLAQTWFSWGIEPDFLAGHSVGEVVAAALSGVMSLSDALTLVAKRGLLMQSMPPGVMLSVRMPAVDLAPRVPKGASIASVNGPSLCVLSGPAEVVNPLGEVLAAEGVAVKPLHTSHAFHSPMMEPALAPFLAEVKKVALSAPKRRIVSTVTGEWLTDEQATNPEYWARHMLEPVNFSKAVATLWKQEGRQLLVEVGPRTSLATLARQQISDRVRQVAVSSLGETADDDAEWTALFGALGQLWLQGVPGDWKRVHAGERRYRVPLPTYPFERKKHWVEPGKAVAAPAPVVAPVQQAARPPPMPPMPQGMPFRFPFPPPTRMPMPAQHGTAPAHNATRDIAPPPAPFASSSSSPASPRKETNMTARKERLAKEVMTQLEQMSGLELAGADASSSFMELGLDSLMLTQVALGLGRAYGVELTFRQLVEDVPSPAALAQMLDAKLPAEAAPVAAAQVTETPAPAQAAPAMNGTEAYPYDPNAAWGGQPQPMPYGGGYPPVPQMMPMPQFGYGMPPQYAQMMAMQQMQMLQMQMAMFGQMPMGYPPMAPPPQPQMPAQPVQALPAPAPVPTAAATAPAKTNGAAAAEEPAGQMKYDVKKAFGAIARISTNREELNDKQRAALTALTNRYTKKTGKSKAFTQEHRSHMADPRVVTGFRPLAKELVYPVVVAKSKGSRLWDVDGNEYIDALNGFGSSFFGYQPDFLKDALKKQIDEGYEIGPQHPLAAEVSKLVCELTGSDRAGLCNTGSEAVMGAMRIARTVTGRSTIAIFTGSYHGIFDEVLVRGTKSLRSIPAAPGILPEAVKNVLVLDYGTPETLEILKSRANDLAAIMCETVQSRRPDFQPREFLHEVRKICDASGAALIFDEVITGFRTGQGGAQEFFGVKADLGTYGKVVGGGLSIGIIAGKKKWMDALDGGHWQFGDASVPTVGVTYFAGTFVRHPLALAAAKASLLKLKEGGGKIQKDLNEKTTAYAKRLNAYFEQVGAPLKVKHFASLWKIFFTEEQAHGDLLFFFLRDKGIHIWDGFPCFLTTAHSDGDVDAMAKAIETTVAEMQDAELLPPRKVSAPKVAAFDANQPPVPGARLGRDASGNPAWFVPNPNEPGKYLQVEAAARS